MTTKAISVAVPKRRVANTPAKQSRSPKRSPDWAVFGEKLVSALAALVEDQYLIISKKNKNQYVQFAAQGAWGMRVETISNHYRTDDDQLSKSQITWLKKRGWKSPSRDPEKSTPKQDPHGSPNFYFDALAPVDYPSVVSMAIDTFVEVMGVSHAGMLEYELFDREGNSLPLHDLMLKQKSASGDASKDQLQEWLADTVMETTGLTELTYDSDGDLGGITYGSATTYIRLLDEPYARFHSTMLKDVEITPQLLKRLNAMNLEHGHLHLVALEDAVVAISDVLIAPFISSHISHSVGTFCKTVDQFKTLLQAEFVKDAIFIEPQSRVTH